MQETDSPTAETESSGEAQPRRKGGRNYVPKGVGNGGRRPGAGRPKGVKNVLPTGAVSAIKAARLRVPETATPEEAEIAGRAFERIVDVMEERVSTFGAFSVLTAAKTVREEICGPVPKKIEASGPGGGPIELVIRDLAKEEPGS